MAPKFASLLAAPGPAAASGAQGTKRRLSEMAAGEGLARGEAKTARGPTRAASAPIEITVFRYGDRACDHLATWPAAARVFQLQFVHEAAPSYAINIVPAFNAYLEHLHSEDASIPPTLSRLRSDWNIVLQITKTSDPNPAGAPLVNWRVVFYIAGDRDTLRDALQLLHGYIAFRAKRPLASDRRPFADIVDQELLVHYGPRIEAVDLDGVEAPVVTMDHVGMSAAPCCVLGCAGPLGNKFLVAEVEVVDDTQVAIGWSGQTWALRDGFEAHGIPLGEDGAGGYIRFVNGDRGNVADADIASQLVDVMSDAVLHRTPCLVRVVNADAAVAGSAADALIARLRELDHLVVM